MREDHYSNREVYMDYPDYPSTVVQAVEQAPTPATEESAPIQRKINWRNS
jgi:hypothetical protein